jgi:thiamine kinase-like enzyme
MIEELPHQNRITRQHGLDAHHLKLTVAKLAKFHAATARLYEDNEELFDQHQQPNITTNFRLFHSLFETCLATITDELTLDDDKLCGKLQNFKHFMIDRVSDAVTLQNEEFGVLCHGDLWMDNLLFQYSDDDDEPIDVTMVRNFRSFPTISLLFC